MKAHFFLVFMFLFGFASTNAQNIDIKLLKTINLNRNTSLDGTFRGLTNTTAFIAYSVPVVLLGFGLLKKDSLIKRNAQYIGASLLTSAAIATILKYSIDRARPFITYPFIQKVAEGGSPSFPSGHTCDAFALATSVSIAYPKWYIILPSYVWACAVGYSRMDLGVHYPSDVLGGMIIGSGSAFLCYKVRKWLIERRKTKTKII